MVIRRAANLPDEYGTFTIQDYKIKGKGAEKIKKLYDLPICSSGNIISMHGFEGYIRWIDNDNPQVTITSRSKGGTFHLFTEQIIEPGVLYYSTTNTIVNVEQVRSFFDKISSNDVEDRFRKYVEFYAEKEWAFNKINEWEKALFRLNSRQELMLSTLL